MRILPALLIAIPFATQGASVNGPVTFNRDIAPIVYRNCSACHRPGEAAPFALLSYQDVVKKGKMIAKVTASHVMPPWKAEPVSYPYRDERRLTEAEIALIQAWVKTDMPEGTGEKPEPPKFASGWRLGEPDLVVEMPAVLSRARGRPGYLSQHRRSSGPDRRQVDHRARHAAFR